ncbi:hypothetical protein N8760_07965 [Rhodobacteraceae bacterium]|nr:hypothetical protein [Paracoccaceae bacterium]
MSFGRLTTAQIESGPLRKTQRTTARSPYCEFVFRAALARGMKIAATAMISVSQRSVKTSHS